MDETGPHVLGFFLFSFLICPILPIEANFLTLWVKNF